MKGIPGDKPSRFSSLLAWIVRWMPAQFRNRFAEEILQTSESRIEAARASGGAWAAWWCGLRVVVDGLASLGLEQARNFQSKHPKFAEIMPVLLIVILLGVFIGWLDLTNTEVQVAVGALLLAGFVVGLTRPRWAWVWATVLGVCVPIAQVVSLVMGFRPPYPHDWHTVLEAFMALIPAFLGMYCGIFVRWYLSWSHRNDGPSKSGA